MLRIYFACLLLLGWACQPTEPETPDRPNVILIMADDMGYECLGVNGSPLYQTPVLDQLAAEGLQFERCISQPLCTPSRVKIMTGLRNYRNYDYFGYLADSAHTFGHLMQEAGYRTCIVGKWQLNGLAYPEQIANTQDVNRPYQLGFDEYCLWQLTHKRSEGERFADPLIEQNGETLPRDPDAYGPDVFCNYLIDFIDRHQDEPFFAYYPMVLVHEPFVPTPDSEAWADPSRRYEKDTAYFKDMVAYTDKIVGRIVQQLEETGLRENTLLIFTGDNGTHPTIYSPMPDRTVRGAKGNTIDDGVHVPLVMSWPAQLKAERRFPALIEFSDFYPTLADLVGKTVGSDGHSFYPLLTGGAYTPRQTAFVHYDPRWSKGVNQYRGRFVQTLDYKLYQDGRFFHLPTDLLETRPLPLDSLTEAQAEVRQLLAEELEEVKR